MRIATMFVTYNGGGGHRALSYAGDVLLGESPPFFGSAVALIEAYCHIDTASDPLPTLGSLLQRYRERVKTMPFASFYRKPKRIELAIHSKLSPAETLLCYDPRPADLSDVPLVRVLYKEIAAALDVIRGRPKRSDDFNAPAFLEFLNARAAKLDEMADDSIVKLLQHFRAVERKRVAANQDVD